MGEDIEQLSAFDGIVIVYFFNNVNCLSRQGCLLTLSPPIPLRLYTLPYWSNPPFLIFDIRALWRSGLSARAPECQKLKMVG